MSALTVTSLIESDQTLSTESLLTFIESSLKEEFDKVKLQQKNGTPEIFCRVKTKLWNPIVSLKGPIRIHIKENKAKVMIDADTKTNGWFWFTLLLGALFWPLWVLMFFLYSSQKKSSYRSLQKVFDRIQFELGKFE